MLKEIVWFFLVVERNRGCSISASCPYFISAWEIDADHVEAAKIVELRFFAGMNEEQIGIALGISTRTVKRDWRLAKVWLLRELTPGQRHGA